MTIIDIYKIVIVYHEKFTNTKFTNISWLYNLFYYSFFVGGIDKSPCFSPVLILNSDIILMLRLGVSIRHILDQKKSFQ